MEKVLISGLMEEFIMVNIRMIKSMDLVYISGQMEEPISATGPKEFKMRPESTFYQMDKSKRENGLITRDLVIGLR